MIIVYKMELVTDDCGVHLRYTAETTYKFSEIPTDISPVTFIPEIPRSHNIKNELFCDSDGVERIRPDTVDGQIRVVPAVPYTYGFIPSTYSPPDKLDPWKGLQGDGDCLDAFFVSSKIQEIGREEKGTVIAALECEDT